jgi:hypothetical protein
MPHVTKDESSSNSDSNTNGSTDSGRWNTTPRQVSISEYQAILRRDMARRVADDRANDGGNGGGK